MAHVEIPDEHLSFLRDLVAEIDNQDNRCTAQPYFYTIQSKAERLVPDGHGDLVRYFDWDQCESYSPDELIELDQQEHDDGLNDDERLARQVEGRNIERYEVNAVWEDGADCNVFFTERGARHHMEVNGHNFRRPTRTYVKHAFRNREVTQLFAAIRSIVRASADEAGGREDGQ